MSASGDKCGITVLQRTPLVLAGGRTVQVNAEAVSANGPKFLIAGTPAYVWRAEPNAHDWRDTTTPIIGVFTDASGRSEPLPPPRNGRTVYSPRVTSAGSGGWHLIFFDGDSAALRSKAIADSAELWYARFDGGAWRDVARIGVVRHARIDAAFSSDLVADGEDLAFAFAYDKSFATNSNANGNQGVVLVRGRPGRWRFDTLETRRGPNYVRLTRSARDGALRAAIIQPYFDDRFVPRASSIFLSRFDSAWGEPRHIAGDGEHALLEPVAVPIDQGFILLWRVRVVPPRVESAIIRDGPAGSAAPTTVIDGSQEFTAVALTGSTVLVLARDGASRDRVRAALRRADATVDLGSFSVPNHLYDPRAVAISSSEVLFITSELGKSDRQVPAATILNRIRVTCSQGG